MAKGKGGRTYNRDALGRFTSGGGGGGKKSPATKAAKKEPAKATAKGSKASKKQPAAAPANKVAASPRRLNKQEKIAAEVMTNKSLRSDRQRRAEAERLGFKGDLGAAFASVRSKVGNPGLKAGTNPAAMKKADMAAVAKVLGKGKGKGKRK